MTADNDKRHLWTGTLPKHPVILLRRGPDFTFTGSNRGARGMDRVVEIGMTVERGEVVIDDTTRGTRGTRPVDFLKLAKKTVLPEGQPFREFSDLPRFISPRPIGDAGNSMTFTFKDRSGKTHGTRSVPGGSGSSLASAL